MRAGMSILLIGVGVGCGPERSAARSLEAERLLRFDQEFIEHLVTIPLDGEALLADPVIGDDVAAGDVGWFLEIAALCALPYETELVVGEEESYPGVLGAWPAWAEAPCGEECQEAVTSCLMTKINVHGITVNLLLKGDAYAEPTEENARYETEYPTQEGAFFGNYFQFPQKMFVCVGEGVDPFHRAFRTCTAEGNSCGFQHLGSCGGFDGSQGQPTAGQVCERFDEDGGYQGCRDRVSDAEGQFPPEAREYRHATTTYIYGSRLGSQEGTCFNP